jgi:hypothetical protein
MTDITKLVREVSERPGMHLPEESLDAYLAYLLGFDRALDGAPLNGLREWLIRRANSGNNLFWVAHVRKITSHEHPSHAIRSAAALILEFLAYRERLGLAHVLGEYDEWLRRQEWYDQNLHGPKR